MEITRSSTDGATARGCCYQGGANVLHRLRWVVESIAPGELRRRAAQEQVCCFGLPPLWRRRHRPSTHRCLWDSWPVGSCCLAGAIYLILVKPSDSLSLAMVLTTILTTIWVCPPKYTHVQIP